MLLSGLVASLAATAAYACDNCYGPANPEIHTRHVRRMQPDALAAVAHPKGPLAWGQLNFIHTTDTHGWLEGHLKEHNYGADWGDFVSFTKDMKKKAQGYGVDLLLLDTGDLHDGAGLSDATSLNGKVSNIIFENIDYDVLTIGNHELYLTDIAYETFTQFSKHYGDRYVTSNVQILNNATGQFEYIGHKYRYFTTPMGLRVMAFGVLYDFTGNTNYTNVITAANLTKESWFIEAVKTPAVNLFLLIGHNPVRPTDSESTLGVVQKAIRQLAEYQAATWFLQGLPRQLARKIAREKNVDIDAPESMNFETMYQCTVSQCDAAQRFQQVYRPNNTEAMEALVERIPARPVVVGTSSNEVWRPATLNLPARHDPPYVPSQRPSVDPDYEAVLLDKMSKLSIRNIRAEIAKEKERYAAMEQQAFPSPRLGNSNSTRLDPAREPRQYGNTSNTWTCFFCGDEGHFSRNCESLRQMETDGLCHQGEDGKIHLGTEEGMDQRYSFVQVSRRRTRYCSDTRHGSALG